MQTARTVIADAVIHAQRPMRFQSDFRAFPERGAPLREMPCHAEPLLTPEEQRICDMATD